MRTSKTIIHLILPAFILALVSVSFGQTPNSASQSKKSANPTRTHTVADRERFKIEGIVAKQDGKVLTLRGSDQKETVVAFTAETDFKLVRKGLFRRDQTTGPTQILLGLRITAEGTSNAEGKLVANKIRLMNGI